MKALPPLANYSISGNYMATKNLVEATPATGGIGYLPHLITTGLESIYEGITIAALRGSSGDNCVTPIMRSSDGQIVTGLYDKDGCRVLVDGGFTRLFRQYYRTTAGTERFVINTACFLVNVEERRRRRVEARAAEIAARARGGGEGRCREGHSHYIFCCIAAPGIIKRNNSRKHITLNDI